MRFIAWLALGLLSWSCVASDDGGGPAKGGASGRGGSGGKSGQGGGAQNGGSGGGSQSGGSGGNVGQTGGSQNGSGGSAGSGTGGSGNNGGQVNFDGPVVMGYVNLMFAGSMKDIDFGAADVVVHAFLAPNEAGALAPVDKFDEYRNAGIVDKAHNAGKKIIFSVGGAGWPSGAFPGIASNPSTRKAFAENVVEYINVNKYDGVDLDYEFPSNDQQETDQVELMRDVYTAVKANNQNHLVVFGVSTGAKVGFYDWAKLGPVSDYAFYFCYDWPGGPMTSEGSFRMDNGESIESSCRGAMNYMIEGGYPAKQIIVGMPFYASNGATPWHEVRSRWDSGKPWTVDSERMEVNIDGLWWTTPEALDMKIDAVLDPAKSILKDKAVAGGVGYWQWGHENPANPDLSQAIRKKVK